MQNCRLSSNFDFAALKTEAQAAAEYQRRATHLRFKLPALYSPEIIFLLRMGICAGSNRKTHRAEI